MKRDRPDRPDLRLIQGGKSDEDRDRVALYGYATRRVRSEPKPRPYTPPTRPAA